MKINKKLPILLGVITLSYISTLGQFKPVQTEAALTAPTSYTYSYYWNTIENEWAITGTTSNSWQIYTRTADGIYYNYTTTRTLTTGLDVTMTFNRSNTDWFSSFGGYEPGESKIGSDNTVGSVSDKFNLSFQNNTNKDYYLYIDLSSIGSGDRNYILTYNSFIVSNNTTDRFFFVAPSSFLKLYLPSYVDITFSNVNSSNSYYFDAWYLQDLGESPAYNAGFDAGEIDGYNDGYAAGLGNNPNILLNGFQAMVGILVNFFLMIVNLEVFGVSISSVFAIIVIFVGIIWTLKIIRG
jgi:hypothetical protein